MRFSRIFPGIALISGTVAYSISLDCEDVGKTDDLKKAIEAWKTMAQYAIGRAGDTSTNHRQGNLLQAMFHAKDENDSDTLDYVKTWLTNAITALDDGAGMVFTCTDKHLTTINAQEGRYVDNVYGKNLQIRAPRPAGKTLPSGVTNACAGINEAFTYTYDNKNAIVVLCSDWDGSALKSYSQVDMENFRMSNLPATKFATNMGIDFVSSVLAYKVAHEIMHATSTLQFPAMVPVSGGSNVAELTKESQETTSKDLDESKAPASTTLQRNADSFALLVCGWYVRGCAFNNGVSVLVASKDRPPATYSTSSKVKRISLPERRWKDDMRLLDPREPLVRIVHEGMWSSEL